MLDLGTKGILKSRIEFYYVCWRRSLRRHEQQVDAELDLGSQRLLTPTPVPGIYILPIFPTLRDVARTKP